MVAASLYITAAGRNQAAQVCFAGGQWRCPWRFSNHQLESQSQNYPLKQLTDLWFERIRVLNAGIMSQEKFLRMPIFKPKYFNQPSPSWLILGREWCGPCRVLGPVVEKIAAANAGKITVGKMNVDRIRARRQNTGSGFRRLSFSRAVSRPATGRVSVPG